ncbi:sugar ABC transporter substrate-binding protein, partial [Rhizobium leguminosarum]
PHMAGPAFDALEAYLPYKTAPAKWIQTESKLYTPADEPLKVFEAKKGQGY